MRRTLCLMHRRSSLELLYETKRETKSSSKCNPAVGRVFCVCVFSSLLLHVQDKEDFYPGCCRPSLRLAACFPVAQLALTGTTGPCAMEDNTEARHVHGVAL